MNSLAKESMNIAVESLKKISETDLADLCNITEQAIKAGGGFGWLTIPQIETLKKYWNGLVLINSNILIVGRLNGTIAGALQISFNPPNNEAQKDISKMIADLTGKPENYVMTMIQRDAKMTFAGSDEPCCFIKVKSIGAQKLKGGQAIEIFKCLDVI